MLEFVAIACAGIFAGAALYISFVQHPAALQAGGSVPARFFPPMYRRAAPMQASLAILGCASGLLAWLFGAGASWLLGSLLLGFVIPFTLLVIKPVNDRLLAADLDPEGPEVLALISRWAALHSVRSIASLLSFVAYLAARAAA